MEPAKDVDVKLFDCSLKGDCEGAVDALAQGGNIAVRIRGATPLIASARNGHSEILRILLSHGSDVNEADPETMWTALHFAAVFGHGDFVELLISSGAIVEAVDYAGMTPLHLACQEGHVSCVLKLMKAGASVSMQCKGGSLPIHIAAMNNSVDIVGTFLDSGCDPNTVS